MPTLRVVWRMATWWQCAILLAFVALFTWPVVLALRSSVHSLAFHLLIPEYGLFLYATLSALINRRSVEVSPQGVLKSNGPIPVGSGEFIPRDEIAICYTTACVTTADTGGDVVLFYAAGVETQSGSHAGVFSEFNDAESAESAARSIANALRRESDSFPVRVKRIDYSTTDDRLETRRIKIWTAIILAAFVAGGVWHVVQL